VRESEQAANEVISGLQNELEDAKKKIAQSKKSSQETPLCNNLSESFPQQIQSWHEFTSKFRDAINGNFIFHSDEETKLDSPAVMKAESLFKELCFDDTQYHESCLTEGDVFQDSLEDENALKAIYGVDSK
jgi:hypothetical protein